ncbi:TPA: hypothetical protein ACX3GV_003791, partial [Vibrio parahaemolyticus]
HSNSPKTKVPKKPYRRFKTSLNDRRSHRRFQDAVTYVRDEKNINLRVKLSAICEILKQTNY